MTPLFDRKWGGGKEVTFTMVPRVYPESATEAVSPLTRLAEFAILWAEVEMEEREIPPSHS